MDLENVGTKIFDFFFDFNFDDFDFLLLLLKVTKVGDLSCVLVDFIVENSSQKPTAP